MRIYKCGKKNVMTRQIPTNIRKSTLEQTKKYKENANQYEVLADRQKLSLCTSY